MRNYIKACEILALHCCTAAHPLQAHVCEFKVQFSRPFDNIHRASQFACVCLQEPSEEATIVTMETILQISEDSVNHAMQLYDRVSQHVAQSSWSDLFLLLIAVYYGVKLLRKAYKSLFEPLNRVRPLSAVGYVPYDGDEHSNLVRRVRENRLAGDLPPLYPNGWYGLLESFQVSVGEAKPFYFCGNNVVVFRDCDGAAHVLDAYCPHLGAHLGAGGRVVGNCIECPFHGWLFDGASGKCTSIPYTDRIPEQAKVRSWAVCEVNNWIYAWYDAEERDPYWSIPEIEDIKSGKLTYRGRTEQFLNAHIEEVPLNGADVVHLKVVHGAFVGAGADLTTINQKTGPLAHRWVANWSQSENPDEKHIGLLSLAHSILAFGCPVPLTNYSFKVKQIGPAVVTLEFDLPIGRAVFLQSVQPVEPLVQRLVHNIYASWTVPTFVAKLIMTAEALQVDRDIMIWNNKRYNSKPLLVKSSEDMLLLKHRRWYSQFYSENSPRLLVQPRIRYGKAGNSHAQCNGSTNHEEPNGNVVKSDEHQCENNGVVQRNGTANGHSAACDW